VKTRGSAPPLVQKPNLSKTKWRFGLQPTRPRNSDGSTLPSGRRYVIHRIMKKMYRIVLFAMLGTAAFAQTDAPPAEKPPAELEQAVRARVNQFYALMLNQDYRKAEALVAEDTKDYYYAGSKPVIHKFEVQGIEFSENFTHAKAITRVSEPIVMAGFPPTEIAINMPTLWKIENGNWCVYEDPEKIANPTGLATKVQKVVDGAAAQLKMPQMGQIAPIPKEQPTDISIAFGKVQVDKEQVKLESGVAETVTIVNNADGTVRLEPGYALGGIETKLDRTELGKGEKAILTLTAGKNASGGFYYIGVTPTGETLHIQVSLR
jgi:hypothetical protein